MAWVHKVHTYNFSKINVHVLFVGVNLWMKLLCDQCRAVDKLIISDYELNRPKKFTIPPVNSIDFCEYIGIFSKFFSHFLV